MMRCNKAINGTKWQPAGSEPAATAAAASAALPPASAGGGSAGGAAPAQGLTAQQQANINILQCAPLPPCLSRICVLPCLSSWTHMISMAVQRQIRATALVLMPFVLMRTLSS